MRSVSWRRRFMLFGLGMVLGSILVVFIFQNKSSSVTGWMPNERILKRLRETNFTISSLARCQMNCLNFPDEVISEVMENGDVDFSSSETKGETKTYLVHLNSNQTKRSFSFVVSGEETRLEEIISPEIQSCSCPD